MLMTWFIIKVIGHNCLGQITPIISYYQALVMIERDDEHDYYGI